MECLSEKEQSELSALRLAKPFVDEALNQLERILASEKFERVHQKAKDFLGFVVGKTLLGLEDGIKEMSIAMAVYGEDHTYDPVADTKVRVAGRDLRRRLLEYYAGEGQNEPIEILLPHGTYVPEIRERRPSIAVAQFENWNPKRDQDYLCNTLSDEIAHRLQHASGVRAGRIAGFEASNPHFRYGLRGSFECPGDLLRLNLSLSDQPTGRIVLSQSFEGPRDDFFKLSRQIAIRLLDVLMPENGHFLGRLNGVPDRFETLQLYQQGRFHFARRTAADIHKAIDLFQRAIEADGQFARAYCGLADCYLVLSWYEVSPPDRFWFEAAKTNALTALSLIPRLPEAITSLAYAKLLGDFDWIGAEQDFQQANLFQNRYGPAHHWYANLLVMHGRFEEAEAEIKRAYHLDSGSIVIRKTMGDPYYYSGRYDQAIDAYQAALKHGSHFWMTQLFLGWSFQHAGEGAKALNAFNEAMNQVGSSSIIQGAIGHLHATTGRAAEARSILAHLKEQPSAPYVAPHSLAVIHAGLGENDQAFQWLEASYENRIELLAWIKVDPRFKSLRADPRFDQFLEKIGLSPLSLTSTNTTPAFSAPN